MVMILQACAAGRARRKGPRDHTCLINISVPITTPLSPHPLEREFTLRGEKGEASHNHELTFVQGWKEQELAQGASQMDNLS